MDNLYECYCISVSIISYYLELITAFLSNDEKRKVALINLIKSLVMDEYNLIHSLDFDEIDDYLEEIHNEDIYTDNAAVSRLESRLVDYKEILIGNSFNTKELNIEAHSDNVELSIYDVIMSMIHIEIMKKVKSKIDALNASSLKEVVFVYTLKKMLELSKIQFIYTLSTSELIALNNGCDIDKLVTLSVSEINTMLREHKNSNEYLNATFYNVIAIYTKNAITALANMSLDNENTRSIFNYLVYYTQMEVFISYMDKNTLCIIYDYCSNIISDENKVNINSIRKLIRTKLNNN